MLRATGIAVASLLALLLLITILLYLPPVQNWAVRQVSAYASEATGMDIGIDHVQLAFPLDLEAEGIHVVQPNDPTHATDTIAAPAVCSVSVYLRESYFLFVEIL